ncbi:MAG TPA: NADH-quinone oxidoreductase subunit J [Methylococcus sp.]|nr:NADH-quinone oxidoreductase subunit J [Methylococcus sp.]
MELALFYLSALIAAASTLMVVIHFNTVHALLYLIVSLLASGFIFYLLGAYFAAVLEVIIYAGAIMVLFVFVIMLLNLGQQTIQQEKRWLYPGIWYGPAALCAVLLAELLTLLARSEPHVAGTVVASKRLGIALFGPYMLAVEAASILLLAGLVGAYHLGRPLRSPGERPHGRDQRD